MRALVDTDRDREALSAAHRAVRAGAEEVVIRTDFPPEVADKRTLLELRSLGRVRLRVTVATLNEEVAHKLGRGSPRETLRGIALAGAIGLPVDVVLPIAQGLGTAAGRLHGLARALPRVARYLLSPVPDDLGLLEPDEIRAEIDDARDAARELSVSLSTDDDTRIDTELQAVLAGVKPVIRLSTEGTTEEALVARYADAGLVATAADGTFIDDAGHHARKLRLVYVARDLATAERVRDIEAKTFLPRQSAEQRASEYVDLGIALGYPSCCVRAYVDRVIRSPVRTSFGYLSEAYVVARGAFDPAPRWQLNHLLFECGDAVITFTPCSYRCPAAEQYASRVLERVDEVAPVASDRLRTRLSANVVVDAAGARALVDVAGGVIVRARRRRTPSGAYVHPLDAPLAERVVGKSVGPDGLIGDEEHPPVLVAFAHDQLGHLG